MLFLVGASAAADAFFLGNTSQPSFLFSCLFVLFSAPFASPRLALFLLSPFSHPTTQSTPAAV